MPRVAPIVLACCAIATGSATPSPADPVGPATERPGVASPATNADAPSRLRPAMAGRLVIAQNIVPLRTVEIRSDNEVRDILKSDTGTIVLQISSNDANCRPCIDANRVFASVAAKHAGRARFIRLNYDPWTNIPANSVAAEHKLWGLPTLLLFQGGQEQRRLDGYRLEPIVERFLAGQSEGERRRSEPTPPAMPQPQPDPLASDTSLLRHNGVWATSAAVCRHYAAHIATAKNLNAAIDFFAGQAGNAYLVKSRGIRFFDEASTECRLVKSEERGNGVSVTMTCVNAVTPDVSNVVLDIVTTGADRQFVWRWQPEGVRQVRVQQCLSMRDLGQAMTRLWRLDSTACTATATHADGRVTFSKDAADHLTIAVSGKVASDYKSDFAARVAVNGIPPVDATAKVTAAGFSLPFGSQEARWQALADGFLLSIWTEEMARAGAGEYRVPVLELPLLGSGRAMNFLRQCQPQRAAGAALSERERVDAFLKDFVARLDREVPDYTHKTPDYRLVDLDDDGRADIVFRPVSPHSCGSAGCMIYVYKAGADGRFHEVYAKQSQDETFPTVGPAAKGGHKSLYFPYHTIGRDRVLTEVAEWTGDGYGLAHYADGDIMIAPLSGMDIKPADVDDAVRDRPSAAAPKLEQQGLGFNLGTTVNDEGRWLVGKACNGCRYGYAKIRQ